MVGSGPSPSPCLGSTDLPEEFAGKFIKAEAPELLANALGQPSKGGLCQGQVYELVEGAEVTIYRAWNSTNPNSEFGRWWAGALPEGKSADYREDYEICYQWSPLDKLTTCTLKAGTRVVIGNGQSAKCSEYLTYPVSAAQQMYIENAEESVLDCTGYDAVFQWQESQ